MTNERADADRPDHQAGLLQILRRHALLVIGTALVAAGVAAALALSREPRYEATAQLLFGAAGPELSLLGVAPTTSGDPVRDAATNVVRVGARPVAVVAARRLEEPDVGALRRRITVGSVQDADVVTVTARAATARTAERTATVWAETFRDRQAAAARARARSARQLLTRRLAQFSARERRSGRGREVRDEIQRLTLVAQVATADPRLLESADDAQRVDDPRQAIALGAMLGLLLGLGLALLRSRADRRLHDDGELDAPTAPPILAVVPRSRALRANRAFPALPAADAEAFRLLHARLRFSPRGPSVVVVTSARDREGKSTVAANLAAAAATAGERTLLVDADLRAPVLASRLDLGEGPGLRQVLSGEMGPQAGLKATVLVALDEDSPPLEVLPSGGSADHRAPALLRSPSLGRLLIEAREHYDFVVVDAAPVGRVADALPLLRHGDGVVLCTLVGRSDRGDTLRVGGQLAHMGVDVLGTVVSGGGRPRGYPYVSAPSVRSSRLLLGRR